MQNDFRQTEFLKETQFVITLPDNFSLVPKPRLRAVSRHGKPWLPRQVRSQAGAWEREKNSRFLSITHLTHHVIPAAGQIRMTGRSLIRSHTLAPLKQIVILSAPGHFAVFLKISLYQFAFPLGIHLIFFKLKERSLFIFFQRV